MDMKLLLLSIISLPSIRTGSELKATNQPPLPIPSDKDHLIVNYSESFKGEMNPNSEARLVSNQGHNVSIIDNLAKIDICKTYNLLWVNIEGVNSTHFDYKPVEKEIVEASLRRRICRKNDSGVWFDLEGFRDESLIYDSCLKYVQFTRPFGGIKISDPIQDNSTFVRVNVSQFWVQIQMHELHVQVWFTKSGLEGCPMFKPLLPGEAEDQVSNTGILVACLTSVLALLIICAVILFLLKRFKKKPTNTEIDQNPEYGKQEYYYADQQKRTNIVEENEEYDGGAYTTDKECYVMEANDAYYSDLS